MNRFQQLIVQVEAFIKKYYKNEILKGGILFVAVLLLSYFLVSGLEYVGRFGSGARFFLFFSFIGVNLFLLIRYLLIPLLKLSKLGQRMSPLEASDMIGSIFPEISDKLKNTLQLYDKKVDASLNLELIHASIEQRSANLSAIPFAQGIDLTENRKYLKYLIPIVLFMIAVGIWNPNLFSEGTERVVNFNKEFVVPAPFEFVLASDDEVKEGEDYALTMKLVGDEIPSELKVHSNAGTYNLEQKSKIEFQHVFSNLTKDLEFTCEANGFVSEKFRVSVLRKPIIESIDLKVVYPKHTGRKAEKFDNTGDITVPEGSIVEWTIQAKNLEQLDAYFKDTTISLNTSLTNSYSFKRKCLSSQDYLLSISSAEIKNADSLRYNIAVVKDEYPTIEVTEEIDSTNSLRRFIEGEVGDDYGIRALSAQIFVSGKDTSYRISKSIGVKSGVQKQLFSYFIDISDFKLRPGDKLEYVFTVTDNDEPNGYKSTTSTKKVYAVPELKELDNILSEKDEKVKQDMDDALNDAMEFKKKIKDVKSDMMNKQNLDWKDKQSLDNLLNMHQDLTKKMEKMKDEFEENKNEKENFLENSEELLEKQQQLQELLDELMDEELLQLLEELQELMEEMNKDQLLENLEEMEMESESLEEELDRALELFKNMELDQKLENLQEQLEELAKEQEELKEQTENKELSNEELAKKQEEINEKFDEIQKDVEEIKEKNEELEKPRDMDFDQETQDNIEQQTDDAKENLENDKNKKASENQKSAAEEMQKMSEQVGNMMQQQQQQQQAEDMDALRYLLENLVTLSHDQEGLMEEYRDTRVTDPKYLELNRQQLDIERNTDIVKDSLIALSKRVFQLSSFINEELAELDYNLNKSMIYSEDRKTSQLRQHQQYAMTGYNDLALMLSEVLSQMQQQAQSQQMGSGSCSKPGGKGSGQSKGPMTMQQMKDALKGQMDQMKNGGKKPGGEKGEGSQKPGGESPGQGGIPGLTPKEIAKMAAMQGQMKESLKKIRQDMNKDGSGAGNQLNDLIDEMDKLEDDLLNGRIGRDLLKRQQDIYTRLLESEKALRERGYSDERESKEGKNKEKGNKIEFTEYNRKKDAEIEFLRSLPVELRVYYKALVNEYFNSVNE